MEKHHFLQKEADHAQTQWEHWAQRYIAIVRSCVFLPDRITAGCTHKDLPLQYGLVREIDYLSGEDKTEIVSVKVLLKEISETLKALPDALPLHVTLVGESISSDMTTKFLEVWAAQFPERHAPETTSVQHSLSMGWVEERLLQPVLRLDLVLILQVNSLGKYADGLAALLLTSDEVAEKYHIDHSSRLLRTMPLGMDVFKDDINLFLETQTIACQSSAIFSDNQSWGNYHADLMTVGAGFNVPWKPDESVTLEKWIGISGPAEAWLLCAFVADMIEIHQQSYLTLFTSGPDHFVSTMTPGNKK